MKFLFKVLGPVLALSLLSFFTLESNGRAMSSADNQLPQSIVHKKTGQEYFDEKVQSFERFNKVLTLIEEQYYQEVDDDILIQGAIRGMLETLDPHTTHLDKKMMEKMTEDTKGEFGGIGIEVTSKDGVIIIIAVIDGSPAAKQGLKVGDHIVEINGSKALSLRLFEAVDLMKGKAGEVLNLRVRRRNEKKNLEFSITREMIKYDPIKYAIVNDWLYIKLRQFQQNSAQKVVDSIIEMKKLINPKNYKGIILDLRGNPGGLLEQAVDVSSIFIESGVVVSTESRDPKDKDIRYAKKSIFKDLESPLIVMIDSTSASASEIVAGAVQDYERAMVVGARSFGKGTVQSVVQIDKDNAVKLTISQYLTPLKRKIQAVGIMPDITFEKDSEGVIREVDLQNHLSAVKNDAEEMSLENIKYFSDLKTPELSANKLKIQHYSSESIKNALKDDPWIRKVLVLPL